jgi:uncharacterized membrane protein
MIQVILYIDPTHPQFNQITQSLSELEEKYPHQLHVVDITQDPVLSTEFGSKAPVLDIGVYRLIWRFDKVEIEHAFDKTLIRLQEAQSKGIGALVERITEPQKMTRTDRFSHWFSRHYMVLLNGFTFLYVFLAVLAPMLMHIGWEIPGKTIYKVYRPLCHQLAFRSFFLFGEQPYYPRELAGVEGLITYGQATGYDEDDLNTAREFLGNERLGYKMALCQRDIAIYSAILLFGLAFSLTGRKIKPLPWYLWLIIGLGPIGLDGFSQLLSQTNFSIFEWLPLRESTPFLRAFTGACFGLATAWFGFPYLEESVLENRREMQLKRAITDQFSSQGQN